MQNNEVRVKRVVMEQFRVSEEEVALTANLVDDLAADSLDSVELIMALEEEFEFEVSDEEADKIVTVADLVALVDARFPATAASAVTPT